MRILKIGDRGKEVLDVQSRLTNLGFEMGTDSVDGFFGEGTQRALLAFQQASGLVADGVVGENTWCELVEARHEPGERLLYLRITPFRGADVLFLQKSLNRLGFNAGPEDGIFGSDTERGVLEFQKNSGLVVDGMVDESVLRAMSRVTKNGEPHVAEAKIPDRNAGGAAGRALSQVTIAIDPAHGGNDEGACPPGSPPEKELTLDIALSLARSLQKGGTRVMLTRETDEDVPLYERPMMANSAGADLFLSIHLNSCGSRAAQGTAAYYFCRQGYYSETGQLLASHIVASVADVLGIPQIPVLGRNYAVLRETEMPAVLIEPYFITCPWSPESGNSPSADAIAESIYRGLEAYFQV